MINGDRPYIAHSLRHTLECIELVVGEWIEDGECEEDCRCDEHKINQGESEPEALD